MKMKNLFLGLLLTLGVITMSGAQTVPNTTVFNFNEPTWTTGSFSGSAVIDNSNGSQSCCNALTVTGDGTQVTGGYGAIQLTNQVVAGKSYVISASVKGDDASEDTPLLVTLFVVDENGSNPLEILTVSKSQVGSGFQYVVFGTVTIPVVASGSIYLVAGEFNGANEGGSYATGQWVIDDIKIKKTFIILNE